MLSQAWIRFALYRFQSFYLRHRNCFLFLHVLSHFNSVRLHTPLFIAYYSVIPGSKADMRLPWAYRSLPRLSSLLEPSHPLGGLIKSSFTSPRIHCNWCNITCAGTTFAAETAFTICDVFFIKQIVLSKHKLPLQAHAGHKLHSIN